MKVATIKNVAVGKRDASTIYCESKSGNIYKLRASVPAARAPTIIAQIRSAKVINIQHWIKIKEGEFKAKPTKAKAPHPEYKEVVVKNQAARIRELQAEVKALKAQLVDQVEGLQAEICAMAEAPSDEAIEEMEIQASIDRYAVSLANKMHNRAIAAKKGWATRRANAQQVAS